MSWRVVCITSVAKLDYKMDYLVVRTQQEIKRIHLSEISVLMIESTAVSLTAYLLCELSKRKIDIIFCDEKRCPLGVFKPLYGSHNTSLKLRNQINWDEDIKAFVWEEIIKAKLRGQIAVLEAEEREEASLLKEYITQVLPADTSNREGHAAKVYFNALFGMSFTRSDENNTNAALNYGYSILLSAFARETAAAGYATQLGIFHDNIFNEFNLACDLMEPFRPFVDCIVKDLDHNTFEHDEKMRLVRVLNRHVLIEGKVQYMLNAIRIYCKSIFEALNQGDISLIKFPKYELQIYEDDSFL